MTRRRPAIALVLAACLACAAPAAALAQNAGDDQYADPFGKVESKKKSSGGGQQGSSGQSGPAPAQQPAPSAPATQSSASQPSASSSQTLPRTGLPGGLLAALGAALLATGAVLRRLSDPPR